jgi:SAM-dependent methyltransferase
MSPRIPLSKGRRLFGADPRRFDRARPEYPSRVFEILEARCGLRPGSAVFEIGPGTGKATRELLRRGAHPLTLIEPDERMVRYLRRTLAQWKDRVRFVVAPFEEADLEVGAYDLGVAATSFHWLRQGVALRRVARSLKPGGWWAEIGNLSGDPSRPNRFYRSVGPIYRALERGPAPSLDRAKFARERARRRAALRRSGRFERIRQDVVRWNRTVDTATLVDLNETFSNVATQPRERRERFFRDLRRLADIEFGGRVTLGMVTRLNTARRK